MKYIVILGDGMADWPIEARGNKTPLMLADTPAMDLVARNGQCGLYKTIPDDMPTGSAVANLSVLGYDTHTCFQGRGVLEAASLGIDFGPEDLVMRVNLVTFQDGRMKTHSAGHISSEAAGTLIRDLNAHFRPQGVCLYPGLSYRHILILPGGHPAIECMPPHDHVGEPVGRLMIRPQDEAAAGTADKLNRLIRESWDLLKDHPVNQKRIAEGKPPANSLWPWSPGKKPNMPTYREKFGLNGAVISAVDLIKGIGVMAGMDVIEVEGATGLWNTNFEGKADAALEALQDHDFVYVHVEAADEAGHEKDTDLKIRCIEDLDKRLVRRILDGLQARNPEVVVALLPDHPTPVATGAHTRDPVPLAIWDPRKPADEVTVYDEAGVRSGALGCIRDVEFMQKLTASYSRSSG